MAGNSVLSRAKQRKALAALQAGRLEEARALYAGACRLERGDASAWFMLATVHGHLGDLAQAEQCFRHALALQPGMAEAHQHLGEALELQGRLDPALECYARAARLRPEWDLPHYSAARVYQARGRWDEAVASYEQCLRCNPQRTEAALQLGAMLQQEGHAQRAEHCFQQVLHSRPDDPQAYYRLGGAYVAQGRLDDALGAFRRAQALAPSLVDARAGEAEVLERQGHVDEAARLIAPLLAQAPDSTHVALVHARLCARIGRPGEPIAHLERLAADQGRPHTVRERECLHFLLGELYDAQGDYERAFSHFNQGNALRPARFDPDQHRAYIDAVIEVYSAGFMATAPRATHHDPRPVFIVGMPRSGTSLAEEILASHPAVYGAGELHDIGRLLESLPAQLGEPYPACVRRLTPAHCDALATPYLAHLQALNPGAQRITDKMPHNFLGLGLINLILPGARVVHCRRDPLDTCLSCYFHDFGGAHDYAYDLGHLGTYYREYLRLMAHWRQTLDIPLLDFDYEAVVQHPEENIRALLDFCGLEWDERCLRFYENQRVVVTSSYEQVHRPIYRDSVGRWRHYEAYLGPLKEALAGGL